MIFDFFVFSALLISSNGLVQVAAVVPPAGGEWPELAPNCRLTGNWSDAAGTEVVMVRRVGQWSSPPYNYDPDLNDKTVYDVTHAKKVASTTLHHVNAGKGVSDDPYVLPILLVASAAAYPGVWRNNAANSSSSSSHSETYLTMACYNDELWVFEVPLGANPLLSTRIFSLSRQASIITRTTAPQQGPSPPWTTIKPSPNASGMAPTSSGVSTVTPTLPSPSSSPSQMTDIVINVDIKNADDYTESVNRY